MGAGLDGAGLDGAGLDCAGLDGAGLDGAALGVGDGLAAGVLGAAAAVVTGAAGVVRTGVGAAGRGAGAVDDADGCGAASRSTDTDGEDEAVGAGAGEAGATGALARLGTGPGAVDRVTATDAVDPAPCCARATPPAVPTAAMAARPSASANRAGRRCRTGSLRRCTPRWRWSPVRRWAGTVTLRRADRRYPGGPAVGGLPAATLPVTPGPFQGHAA